MHAYLNGFIGFITDPIIVIALIGIAILAWMTSPGPRGKYTTPKWSPEDGTVNPILVAEILASVERMREIEDEFPATFYYRGDWRTEHARMHRLAASAGFYTAKPRKEVAHG